MGDEWSQGINWFQYMASSSCGKNFFFSKSSFDQYSAKKSFEESLDERIADITKYKSNEPVEQNDAKFPEPVCAASHCSDTHELPKTKETHKWNSAESAPKSALHEKKGGLPPEKKVFSPPEKKGVTKESDQDASWKQHRLKITTRPDLDKPGSRQTRPDMNVISETPFKYSYLAPLKNPRIPYPRESSLTHEEHKRYLELFTHFVAYVPSNPTPAEIKDILIFKELQMKVGAEQEEFMKYLEEAADKCIDDYIHIQPEAREFSEALLTTRLKRSSHYPRLYFPSETISLQLKRPFDASTAPVLSCQATLLQLGPTPKVVLPTISHQTKPKASLEYDKLCKRYPPRELSEGKTKAWSKEDLSSDVNAEKLAIQYGADVVLSAGGVTCIMNNHGPAYERDWEIPIVIKEYVVDENGKKVPRKVVFIDKPLVPKIVCARYLNTLYHKYALKATLIHQQSKPPAKFRTKGKDVERSKDNPDMPDNYEALESYAIEDLETFGTDKINIGSKPTSVKEVKKDQVDLKNLARTLFCGRSGSGSERGKVGGGIDPLSGRNSCEEGAMELGPSVTPHAGVDQVVTDQGGVTKEGADHDSPQSPDMESPQSPESKHNDSPQSPDSRCIESPMSPTSHDQAVVDLDRRSPLSPSAEAPSSSRDLFLSAPRIIPVERIESETKKTLRGTEVFLGEGSGAQGRDATSETDGNLVVLDDNEKTDVSLSRADENKAKSRKCPVRRSLRGSNVDINLCVGTKAFVEDGSSEESPMRRARQSTQSSPAKGETKVSRVADTESDEDLGLVMDVESEDNASPPRRQTRQRARRRRRSRNNDGLLDSSDIHSSAVTDELETRPRITRSTSAVDMKSFATGSRSLRCRAHDNSDEAVTTVTSPMAKGRVTRGRQSPVSTSEMECGLLSSGKKRQSVADHGREIPNKRSTRNSGQGLPPTPPLDLPQPRKRGRPRKHTQETPTKQSHGAVEEIIHMQVGNEKSAADIMSSDETKGPGMPPEGRKLLPHVTMITHCDDVALEMDNNSVGEKSVDERVIGSRSERDGAENKPESSMTLHITTKGQENVKINKKVKSENSSTTLDAILNLQQQMLRPGEKMNQEAQQRDRQTSVQQTRPCSQDNNATYRLWSLADLNLIIRTSDHGFLRDPSSLKAKPVYLFPKMEYQPMFGVEQVTVSEQAKMWTSAFLRLNCNIIRARICAFTSEIMMLEDVEPSKILPPRGMFEPGVAMQKLHTVLDKVVSLPPGVHILKHSPGESHAQILQHILSKKSGSYDLHQSYIIGDLHDDDDPVKWVPLDPNVILPFHRWLYRIPATFKPKGGLINFSTKKYDDTLGKVVKKMKKSRGKKKKQ